MQITVDYQSSNAQTHSQEWEEDEEDCHSPHAADIISWWVYFISTALFATCIETDNLNNTGYKYNECDSGHCKQRCRIGHQRKNIIHKSLRVRILNQSN